MFFFKKKSKAKELVYPVGTEVWGFFHPGFKTSAGSNRCRKAR